MPGSEILAAQAAQRLDDLTAVVARACARISAISREAVVRREKPDQSPVTNADEASEAAILHGLTRVLRGVPVVSEESPKAEKDFDPRDSFVIVDPLDGTREFLAGTDEFTVNLAIVTHGVPIAGIIAAPKRGRIWRGVVGLKAERLYLTADGGDRAQTISNPSLARRQSVRRREPIAHGRLHRFILGGARIDHPRPERIGNQILPGRRGYRRHLPSSCHDLRMGCGGRPRTRCRCRWRCDWAARNGIGVWACPGEFSCAGIHRLGRRPQGCRSSDPNGRY